MSISPEPKPEFAPIKTQRAFEVICERIRADLASGALKAGDKLPPERELAQMFQVSRGALREALRSLEVAGIIRNVKGARGGSFVQAAEPDRVMQAVQDYFHLGRIGIDELTEARIALQDVIVRLACQRATEDDLDRLEAITRKTMDARDVQTRFACAVEFYDALARATGNRMFGVLVASLSNIFSEFVNSPGYGTLQESLIQSRLKLMKHLRARDEDAAAAEMRDHLERVRKHVLRTASRA